MTSQAEIDTIHIVNVTSRGQTIGFNSLEKVLSRLPPNGFIAIDAEFSGFGAGRGRFSNDLNTRYIATRGLANSRAIFSVGVAVFIPKDIDSESDKSEEFAPNAGHKRLRAYEVATFDFLTRCEDEFTMNSGTGKFLVENGFNFHDMYRNGISYSRASTTGKGIRFRNTPYNLGGLLSRFGQTGAPLIVHNRVFDLAFLFAAFHGPLPDTLTHFARALIRCVPGGYWDTKKIASSALSERDSNLHTLFARTVPKDLVSVHNCGGLPDNRLTDPPDVPDKKPPEGPVLKSCENTIASGGAVEGDTREKLPEGGNGPSAGSNQQKIHTAHTSGWDAFCTGYLFAAFRSSIPQEKLELQRNKIALSRKPDGWMLKR